MAVYKKSDYDHFMKQVTTAPGGFTRKRSSLRDLLKVLEDNAGNAQKLATEVRKISPIKQQKYWKALLYLRQTYPLLPPIPLLGGNLLGKLNAAKFKRNKTLPPQWGEDFLGQEGANKLNKKSGFGADAPYSYEREMSSVSNSFLNKSLEHYIFENGNNVVGVLIHMGAAVDELNLQVEGVTHLKHLVCAITALEKAGAPLCVLLQDTDEVCTELRLAVNKCKVTSFKEEAHHMGGQKTTFQDFVENKTVILMGFDGDVCVAANAFGSGEIQETGTRAGKMVIPIIHLADIVTSRAVLLTKGTLSKVDKWGVLQNT